MIFKTRNILLACSALLILTACGETQQSTPQQSFPTIEVGLDSVSVDELYSATIEGRQDVQIYPQVSGTITRVCVKEGEKVRKGQSLFIIDQVPYQAALRTATANVHAAEAQVESAGLEYESKKILFDENVISEYDLSLSKIALAIAEAALEQAKAGEINAKNDLSYTEVKSPVDGIIGILPYRAGTLVSPSIPQPLTTVSDNEQMFVYFSMTENQLRSLFRQYGSPEETIRQMPEILLQLNDGTMYDSKGYIESISGIINSQTGTASIRAVFPNKNRLLFSGGIGNVVLSRVEMGVIVIPQGVTYEIQDKIFVYKVVDGKAVSTEIKIAKYNDGKRYIVHNGLSVGDKIISEGVGLVQDGIEVESKE